MLCAVLSLQLCPTLCDPSNGRPPGSPVPGILQAKHWSGLSFPSPGDLPNPGIEPASLAFPALAGGLFSTSATWEALQCYILMKGRKGEKEEAGVNSQKNPSSSGRIPRDGVT